MLEFEIQDTYIKRYILEKLAVSVSTEIPQHMLITGKLITHLDMATEALVIQLKIYMAARTERKVIKRVALPVYKTWWDMLKDEYIDRLPKWINKRLKQVRVKFIARETIIHNTRICPHIEVPNGDIDHIGFLVDMPEYRERNRIHVY